MESGKPRRGEPLLERAASQICRTRADYRRAKAEDVRRTGRARSGRGCLFANFTRSRIAVPSFPRYGALRGE